MLIQKRSLTITLVGIFLVITNVFSMQQKKQPQTPSVPPPITTPATTPQPQAQITQAVESALKDLTDRIKDIHGFANAAVRRVNESMALAYNANHTATEAFKSATESLSTAQQATTHIQDTTAELEQIRQAATTIEQQAQAATANLEGEYERIRTALNTELTQAEARINEAARAERSLNLEDTIRIEQAKIQTMQQQGIYERTETIRAQIPIKVEQEKWKNIKAMLGDINPAIKLGFVVITIALCFYGIKHGIPMLFNKLTKPRVISETSRTGWFNQPSNPNIDLNDLIFPPALQEKLFDLWARIQTAKQYHDPLPNVLLYGPPGTGKTAFVKALAYDSGLDFALTSGSEFAKITDLNDANNELRKLLNWSKNNKNGLIVFIDEAESLFANRKLLTTSKGTQDFINTFLSLISDQSQKNVMFIFATNHPFKLDDALSNRIGINIKFEFPAAPEREKMFFMYLVKNAEENKNNIVTLDPEVHQQLHAYAEMLDGFSPRAISFVAKEIIAHARRQQPMHITHNIVEAEIDKAKQSLEQTLLWEKERDEWYESLIAATYYNGRYLWDKESFFG